MVFCVLLFFWCIYAVFLHCLYFLKNHCIFEEKTQWFYDHVYFTKMHFSHLLEKDFNLINTLWTCWCKNLITWMIHSYGFLLNVLSSFIIIKETNQNKWKWIDLLIKPIETDENIEKIYIKTNDTLKNNRKNKRKNKTKTMV